MNKIPILIMQILVTGGAGYVGSELVTKLIEEHDVICLDRFFFGDKYLKKLPKKRLKLCKDDIRWFNPSILEGVDIVMDLAALSNDPSAELDPTKTYDINYLGRSRVARLSKKFGVKKYILASTASVYGFQKKMVNEKSVLNPLTTYAKANLMAEKDIMPLSDENFSVTALRFATIYGESPRMRFDLAVNIMTYHLFKNRKLTIDGNGKQSRPFVHVKDAVRAYELVIKNSVSKVNGEIFNVGSEEQNYEIGKLAHEIVDAVNKDCEIINKGTNDIRSYILSFNKIKKQLQFKPKFSVKDGVKEIYSSLISGSLQYTKKTITLDWYKHLLESQKLTNSVSQNGVIL